METLIKFLVEGSICLFLFYILYYFLLSREAFFQVNRVYLLGSVFLSILFPFLNISLSTTAEVLVVSLNTVQVGVETTLESSTTYAKSFVFWLGWMYVIGVILAGIRFLYSLFQIGRFIRSSEIKSKEDHYLIRTKGVYPTFTFLNYLCWDNTGSISREEENMIKRHERVHIRQNHTYEIILMEVVTIVFWFYPIIYVYKNSLKKVHEYIADREVAESLGKWEKYEQLLAKETLRKLNPNWVHSFFNRSLKNRYTMLYKNSNKLALLKYLTVLPVAGVLFFFIACEQSPQPVENSQQESLSKTDKSSTSAKVYKKVETMPHFPGGNESMMQFVYDNIDYPEKAEDKEIEGMVVVSFIVDEEGNITKPEILRSLGHGCDEEVLKVIDKMPQWEPGKRKDGTIVPVKFQLPVKFSLD